MSIHILQIRLNDEEYAFLKRCAGALNKSLAQTMLHLADFRARMLEENQPLPDNCKAVIKGVPFTENPFEDYEF